MRIVSFSENRNPAEMTAQILNDRPGEGCVYHPPLPGYELRGLTGDDQTRTLFREFLRELVGEWIRCGKKIMPRGVQVWAVKGPRELELSLRPQHLKDGKMVGAEIYKFDPSFSSWLWKVCWDYLHRTRPNCWFVSSGEICFIYETPTGLDHEFPQQLPPFLELKDSRTSIWTEALYWFFIILLNSKHPNLLDRCVHCRQYFVRRRELRTGYQYKQSGPHCGECKTGGSIERMQSRRQNARDRMLGVASVAWSRWTKTHKAPNRYEAVRDAVNAKCWGEIKVTHSAGRIEVRWVKRNEAEIIERVEKLPSGKR